MSTGLLPYIYDINKNPLHLLGILELHVLLGSTKEILKIIVCETLAAPTITGADFCDQYVLAIRPEQKLVELNNGDRIPIVQEPWGQTRSQSLLPDELAYPENNQKPSPLVRVAEKVLLSTHSQTWVTVQTAWTGTAALQPYTPFYHNKSTVAANYVLCVKPNVPFQVLVANMGNHSYKLFKS